MQKAEPRSHWDVETDVVVVGYGFAGGVAAVAAHDRGAQVLVLEKMPYPGGISMLSAGSAVITDDAEQAFQYLQRTNAGTTPDPVLRAFAQEMVGLPACVEELAAVSHAQVEVQHGRGGPYPFPGTRSLGYVRIAAVPEFTAFPWGQGLRGGARLYKVVADNVSVRGVRVWLDTAAEELLCAPDGTVVGLKARQQGRAVAIRARRGVVLACGGFEHSEALKRQYFPAQPVYGVAALGNMGDGILMAQKAGAALWHMWHYHGSYGFKFPDFPTAFRTAVIGPRATGQPVPWIAVNKLGKRFMDEFPIYLQDTGARPMEHYDTRIQDFPAIPAYLLFDEAGRRMGPIGLGASNEPQYIYEWSQDNLREVQRGWIACADTWEQLAHQGGLSPTMVQQAVARWNSQCLAGGDPDFGRLPETMMPLQEPPYYAVQIWPVVSNTQGGPVHDERQRILDSFGQPIPRLYSAGELGSIFGHLYLGGGNIAECFIGGRIAGAGAAQEEPG
ncbi:MAG: FAD-binding protein [Chloroflexi bacterium]|nr:FAD-binding protein [Chloroflexota bacterium]